MVAIGEEHFAVGSGIKSFRSLKVSVEDLYDNGKSEIEDIATKQAVAEFKELKPKERGFVLTIIRELKKLRGEG